MIGKQACRNVWNDIVCYKVAPYTNGNFFLLDPTLSSLIAEKISENAIRITWDVNSTGGADITRFTVSAITIVCIHNNTHWEK